MTDTTEIQDQQGPDAADTKVDAVASVVVVAGLVSLFLYYIWSAGWN